MKVSYDDQLLFDFSEAPTIAENKSGFQVNSRHPLYNLKRAVLAWILAQEPTGIGLSVPTRFSKYQADIAAFWSQPVKGRFLMPFKTMIVETRLSREECCPECSNKNEIFVKLRKKKEEKRAIEAEIRNTEPELKENDILFNDFESWNYAGSKNKNYHKCIKEIKALDHAIYKGSRFERIMHANVATLLYLAVPYDAGVHADEIADGWGLLYVDNKLGVKVVKEAEERECPEKNKLHLVQNIAASCLKALLLSCGIRQSSKGECYFTRTPRIPRAPKLVEQ